ncbi:TPA: polymer-forming cytoskeletal protein [Streptococcus agalactiae]
MKKYELLKDDTIEVAGKTLFRIKALISFKDIRKGEIGGYVEAERNLSQSDNAWVTGNAWVCDDACVTGNARVSDNAWVTGNAWVCDDACVTGNARVSDNACVTGNAWVCDDACVTGNARVSGNAWVCDDACVTGNARVSGNAWVTGNARVSDNAWVETSNDYIVFKNNWSSFRWFTYTKSNKMWRVGCFYGTGDELIKEAYADSEESGRKYELYVNLVKELYRDE